MDLRALPLFSLLVLFGCSSTTVVENGGDAGPSSNGSGGAGGGGTGGGGVVGSSVTPASGAWTYNQVTRASDNCHLPALRDPDGDFQIEAGAGSFLVTPGDGTDPFNCSASGAAFSCPDRAWQKADLAAQGYSAVVTARATAAGTIGSSTELRGHQDLQVTCTGSDCAALAAYAKTAFPCTIGVTFAAVKKP